jgi:hypothetical protein
MTLIFWIVHKQYKIFFLSFISHAWGYINRTPGSNLIVNVHYIDSGEFDKINETKFIVKIHLIHRWCPNAWLALAWASIWLLLRADQLGWPCQTKLCQRRLVRPVSAGSAYPDWSPPALPRSPAYEMRAAGEDYPEKIQIRILFRELRKKCIIKKIAALNHGPRRTRTENLGDGRLGSSLSPNGCCWKYSLDANTFLAGGGSSPFVGRRPRLPASRHGVLARLSASVPYAWLRARRFISARYDLPIAARRRSANQCLLPVMYAMAARSSPAGRNSV